MNECFLMERCFGNLICPVFLYKRIQGLIRKTACFALGSSSLEVHGYTNTSPSAGTGDEHQLWLHQLGRGRQGVAARNQNNRIVPNDTVTCPIHVALRNGIGLEDRSLWRCTVLALAYAAGGGL